MSRIFISYSRKDIDAAKHIADELRGRGVDVFVDYQRLKAGENFPERLATEIEQADAVVFLLSQHSAASDWVRDEIQYARHCRKKIIPVGLDTTDIPRAFFFLMAIERVDFTRWLTDRQVEAAIVKLAAALGLPVELTQVPPSVEAPSVGEGLRPSPTQAPPIAPSPPTPLPQGEGGHRAQPPIALPDVSAILPPPFEWCWIPAGKVTLEEGGYILQRGQTFDVPAFAIAKYPITNAQFEVFIDAKDGYRDADWWAYSDGARAWRKKNTQPRSPAFGGVADHPRANVSWYEAVAFCRWLTETVRARHAVPLPITLPPEQQWQRAAQGDDGRKYPWGNEPDTNRCNVRESGIGQTTSVTQYPSGASPYGVMDIAGNVWEWCLTDYEVRLIDVNKSSNRRVLRGGSWDYNQGGARAAYRFNLLPTLGTTLSVFGWWCVPHLPESLASGGAVCRRQRRVAPAPRNPAAGGAKISVDDGGRGRV